MSFSHVSHLFNAALAGCVAFICIDAQSVRAEGKDTPRFVKTIIAPDPAVQQSRRFFGTIVARETVDLSFEVGGRLERLEAMEGSQIAQGARLAELDLASFKREVERAEVALAQAERDLRRAQHLARTKAASEVRALDAQTARDLADVALREAREALADATILAPFDTLVARRIAAVPSTVAAGQPILRVHDMSEVRVEFDLPERVLTRLGDPAKALYSAVLPGDEEPVPLSFVEFHAETGGVGQSYVVALAVPRELGSALIPGAAVTVNAVVASNERGVELPPTALVAGADRSAAVFVVEGAAPATVRRVAVTVRSESGRALRVSGVAPGAEIVAAGAHLLCDGAQVKRWTGLSVEE